MMPSTYQMHRQRPAAGIIPHGSAGNELDPHDLLRILRRRKWVVLGTLAAVLAVAALYLVRATPMYTASTTLEVLTYSAEASMNGEPQPLSAQDEIRIATHMELLTSPTLGQIVVEDLKLLDDPEFAPDDELGETAAKVAPADREELEAARMAHVIERLFDQVSVNRIGQSALIRVSATSSNPNRAAEIANVIAGTHRKYLIRDRRSSTNKEIESLTVRAGELRAQAIEGERAAVEQGQRAGVSASSLLGSSGQVERLQAQLSDAAAQRAAAETRYAQLGGIGGGMSGPGSGASPLLADLRAQKAELDKRIAELGAQFGPGHPDMRSAEAQRDDVARRLAEEMSRTRREAGAEIAAARAREGQISADLGAARAQEMRAGEVSVGVSDLQRSAATNRELYLSQLARLQDMRGKEQSQRPEATIVAKALVPTERSSPQIARLVATALTGGLLIGIILAFAVEMFDRKLRTAEQVKRVTGLDTISMVPEVSEEDAALSPALLLRRDPTSAFSETIRSLCLDLVGRVRGTGRCIVITSALPKEGKTFLSVSVAAAAAMIGRKVVIVDLDLRRPSISQMLNVPPSVPDLVDCLEGDGALDPDVVVTALQEDPNVKNLSILSVSRLPEDPGSLLASPRVADLVEILRRRFDFIVLNSPPILPVRDARHLATFADVTLLVIRWGRTNPDAVSAAQKILGHWTTGAIINRVNMKRHAASHYGDRIQHYSDYASYFGAAPAAPKAGSASEAHG